MRPPVPPGTRPSGRRRIGVLVPRLLRPERRRRAARRLAAARAERWRGWLCAGVHVAVWGGSCRRRAQGVVTGPAVGALHGQLGEAAVDEVDDPVTLGAERF